MKLHHRYGRDFAWSRTMKVAALTIPTAARLFAVVGAYAAVLLLLGCGSSGDEGTTPASASAASAEKPTAAPSEVAPSAVSTPTASEAPPTEITQTGTPTAARPSPTLTPPMPTATAALPTATPEPTATPVAPALSILIAGGSEARYRVRERLAGRDFPNDAVGVTTEVTGSIAFDEEGGIIAERSKIAVDVSSLESDEGRRDRYIRNNSLESNRFPIALFEARATRGLSWPLPASGEVAFQLLGEMNLHGVAKPITWEVAIRFGDGQVTGQALTTFTFGYFNMAIPRAVVVLSVEDQVQLELDFTAAVETGG